MTRQFSNRTSLSRSEQILPTKSKKGWRQLPRGLIELRARAVTGTSKFTKTLFVPFDSSPRLLQLRVSLGGNEADFDPHLSLLYKRMPEKEHDRLAITIKLPFQTATFDAVQAVHCRVPVTTSADVALWQVVASRRLTLGFT